MSNMSTMTKEQPSHDEAYFTLEFLFNSGKTEPSRIEGLPRSQVYRFGCDELMDWMDLTEEEAMDTVDKLMNQIDSGKSKYTRKFKSGETFRIICDN